MGAPAPTPPVRLTVRPSGSTKPRTIEDIVGDHYAKVRAEAEEQERRANRENGIMALVFVVLYIYLVWSFIG